MADTPKNPDDQPGDDDGPIAQELDDLELEKWTNAFDQLTNSAVDKAPDLEAHEQGKSKLDVDGLFDEGMEFGEALGDLLGAPPPLPLPDGSEEIMSSAPRPVRTS